MTNRSHLPLLALAAGLLVSLSVACSGDEGTTPKCPKGSNDCFTQPDGGTPTNNKDAATKDAAKDAVGE